MGVTDANGNVTQYDYDGLDRLSRTTFADSTFEQLSYDIAGSLCSGNDEPCRKVTRRASVNTIDYTCDALDRLMTRTPAGSNVVSLNYDLTGNVLGQSNTIHATGYVYDTAGRKKSETNDGRLVSYMLDSNGNRTMTQRPDSYYVSYEYVPRRSSWLRPGHGGRDRRRYTAYVLR